MQEDTREGGAVSGGSARRDARGEPAPPGRSSLSGSRDPHDSGPSDKKHQAAEQLELARRDLLDLSLRNPLLNYRLRKTRGLALARPSAVEIFSLLVLQERALTFLAAGDGGSPDGTDSGETDAESPDAATEPAHVAAMGRVLSARKAERVFTPHTREELERRLVATYRLARTITEEQGINALFVALGALTWYESQNSEEPRKAPLVLVPIELERTGRGATFRARYTGDDVSLNLSLLAKLRIDFGIELPGDPTLESDADLLTYFGWVERAVRDLARWSVDKDAAAAGFFSYAKFQMFHDLDPNDCLADGAPPGSSLLHALLGDGLSKIDWDMVDEADLDRILRPDDLFQVCDADSTQTAAILDGRRAPCLVVQGPPGTGKSQTITNIIAEAVAAGQTVLFVAEKRAALEVVRRRLAKAGLSQICLELHSNKTDKRAVLEDLKRTLNLTEPQSPAVEDTIRELAKHRDRLNAYCEAMNTFVGNTSTTPYEALGRLLRLHERIDATALPPGARESVTSNWTNDEFRHRFALLSEVEQFLRRTGNLTDNPFWGSRRESYLPQDHSRIAQTAEAAERALVALIDCCKQLSEAICCPSIDGLPGLDRAVAAAQVLVARGCLSGIAVRHQAWVSQGERIAELLSMGKWLRETHRRLASETVPQAWTHDFRPVYRVLGSVGSRWYRVFQPTYRKAVRELQALCVGQCPRGARERLGLVKDLMRAQAIVEEVGRAEPLLRELFPGRWQGNPLGLAELAEPGEWLIQIHKRIAAGEVPHEVLEAVERDVDASYIGALTDQLRTLKEDYTVASELAVRAALAPDGAADTAGMAEEFQARTFASQHEELRRWRERPDALREVADYNYYAGRLDEEGLRTWVEFLSQWKPEDGALVDFFASAWFTAIRDRAFRERPALARFRGAQHDQVVEGFRNLDRTLIKLNAHRVAVAHWSRCQKLRGGGAAGQLGTLRQEFEKKRRHLPLRKLLEKAGPAVQQIKPVFMMSPLSVASLLPKGALEFDLVVFDEASQVRPVDAFGSILRGRRVVVIGDTKQLPPTTFFDKLYEVDGGEDEEFESPGDVESILGLFCAKGVPERMLRWHYRSQHHSLIAVSNNEFYDGKLIVYPNADWFAEGYGVVLHYLPETVYEPGPRRAHNPKEAEAVARAVMKHAREFPDLSLGVVAFSLAQAHLIEDYVDKERRRDVSADGFFSGHPEEPFFVKNLESVQGDERDVIFISVGYGRQQNGRLHLNFGPLNHAGGERRLNVLITRARRRCEVFCNFRADDLLLERSEVRGVVALKQYLRYAESRQLEVAQAADREPGSPFEEEVADCIRKAGYQVHHQIGSRGYFVDLGVVDPERPGCYLIGIECDGASYHSGRWARDRDRLRQEALEARGWKIHRVWSTDWFSDRQRVARRVIEAIENARRGSASRTQTKPGTSESAACRAAGSECAAGKTAGEALETAGMSDEAEFTFPGPNRPVARPYQRADMSAIAPQLRCLAVSLHLVPPDEMAKLIRVVVNAEAPVHPTVIAKRLREAAGLQRTGSRISGAVDRGIDFAIARGHLIRRGDFVWRTYHPECEPRDRSGLPPSERDGQLIAPEEIAGGVVKVVRASFGVERTTLVSEVIRLLGFGRASANLEDKIGQVVDRMCSNERLVQRGAYLYLPS